MTAQILDGKATAAAIKSDLTVRVAALKEKGITPGLGTILVGDDPGSQKYVAGKHRDCAQVGIASIQRELPATATQEEIEAVVRELNEDPACTGYIVQLPLPKGIDENRILELMDPDKAVFAQKTEHRTLSEAIAGADVFLGLSAGGVLKKDMVAKMAANPLIFALANPNPEITPEDVKAVRDDAIGL